MSTLAQLAVTYSAKVEGKKTNRVTKVRNPTRTAPSTYKPRRGRAYKLISISIYLDDLTRLDAKAEQANVSRSEFIRMASERMP